ncbi:MAG: insulinase family protein [Bacteroidetes bacterium]|nr:insulinase family protein [Bacteroidota bacterium]
MAYRNKLIQLQKDISSSYKKTILPNGIRVLSEEIPFVKSVSIGVWIDTGSKNEHPENNGISHFIEHMVFKGTKHKSIKTIAQSLESVGGYMNAFTTKEHTCFYARVLDEYAEKAVDVLSDLVQYPEFREKEMVKEKSVVMEEIKTAEDDPDDQVHEYFEKHLFGQHSLGLPVIGTSKNVSSFTQKQLKEYAAKWYVPHKIVVAAAGNISHTAVVNLVEKYFHSKRRTDDISFKEKISLPKKYFHEYLKPIQQAHICTGTLAFSVNSRYRYPALVMNTLLGDGMSSRLFQQIRERHGLAYSTYSYLSLMKDSGLFGLYIGTDKEHVQQSLDLAYNELRKLQTKLISKSELQRTKAQLKGNMLLSLESTSNRMMRLGSGELYFGNCTPLDTIAKNIDQVTPDDIQHVAKVLFGKEQFTTVILSPQNSN